MISGSRLVVVQDSGHMVMMEKPREINQLIDQFILEDR